MPEISLFFGIRITMYYSDHNPPHFHAEYAGYKALIDVVSGCVIRGSLPNRQLRFVLAWTELHRDELMQNWELAKDEKPLNHIKPLDWEVYSMDTYFPTVVQAVPGNGRIVYAYFTDGSIRAYDMQPHIDKGGVFAPLKDEDFFVNRLTVLNSTIAWDVSGRFDPETCLDIDPFTVYQAEAVSDPLAESNYPA